MASRNERRKRKRHEKEKGSRSRLRLILHSRLRLPRREGGGGTDDSDSRAKSYSFGPSTTWPRHNRVKVASCLSPRGSFRGAREGRKRGEIKIEKKNI